MPNIKSSEKRVKVAASKALDNKKIKRMYRNSIKEFEAAVEAGSKDIKELLEKAISSVDKAWSKGVIKRNTADRKKAKMTKKVAK